MRTEVIFEMESCYRESFKVIAHYFGGKRPMVCVLGNLRGNEIQQLYISGMLVKRLKEIEEQGLIRRSYGICVVPTANPYSINIGKRFWAMDNSDINRMFPGYDKGETTQRIAAGIFDKLQGYKYGIHVASFYIPGDFVPHVRMIHTPYQDVSMGELFGLPFVVLREPVPFDTTTLNFNWQVWGTMAYSIYSNSTDQINQAGAEAAVSAILRFLARMRIIDYNVYGGNEATIFPEDELQTQRSSLAWIFVPYAKCFDEIRKGEVIAKIVDPITGEDSPVVADVNGIVFFRRNEPLVMAHQELFMVVPELHR
ncbi:MAG: M14 family metallopeptidase [Burkholderiales bacterium]|nr:M14 family metallopeptidase [Burkholderiales bacterium]